MSLGTRNLATACVALALLAPACSHDTDPASQGLRPDVEQPFPVTLTDDEGVVSVLVDPPDRIVTFSPAHTEIVFALGLGERLAGVSGSADDDPPQAAEIASVGDPIRGEPDVAKVESLEPDLLMTELEGGEWKNQLRSAGIPVFTTLALSFEDALADIGTLGRLLGAQVEANELIAHMALDFGEVQEQVRAAERVTCFLDLGDELTVGPGALEFDLLRKAGCKPVTARVDEPYPRWSEKQVVAADPEVYLLSAGSPPFAAGRAERVDADLISRPGPRMVEGIEQLAAALHDGEGS